MQKSRLRIQAAILTALLVIVAGISLFAPVQAEIIPYSAWIAENPIKKAAGPIKNANLYVNYAYTKDTLVIRDISPDTVEWACDNMVDNQTVIMYSDGGVIGRGLDLGQCFNQKNIRLIVDKALSIAPLTALYSNHVCIMINAEIGTHQPRFTDGRPTPRVDVLEAYDYIYEDMVASGLSGSAADTMINYMDSSLYTEMLSISISAYSGVLGDSFKGICTVSKEVGKPWTL